MANFKHGWMENIYYEARPIGKRKLPLVNTLLPYRVGIGVTIELIMKCDQNIKYNQAVLYVYISSGHEVGEMKEVNLKEVEINEKKQWRWKGDLLYPMHPCSIACELQCYTPNEGTPEWAGRKRIVDDLSIHPSDTIIWRFIAVGLTITAVLISFAALLVSAFCSEINIINQP